MSMQLETTLAGYARAAVDLKAWMTDYTTSATGQSYLQTFTQSYVGRPEAELDFEPPTPEHPDSSRTGDPHASGMRSASPLDGDLLKAMALFTSTPWRHGEPYVLAPVMTAVVAAAADALDLTGDVLSSDLAPADYGVVFLPQPVYLRNPRGQVVGVGAITWAKMSRRSDDSAAWLVCGWADRADPHDPSAAETRAMLAGAPQLAARFGPYLLGQLGFLPIGTPVNGRGQPRRVADPADQEWQPAPDGRYCIADTRPIPAVCSLLYAFWRIQAQPLATVARPPLDRAARRRAERASIRHDTRIVMLRRTSPLTPEPAGEAKWHYHVRFVVRGHWRNLTDRDGNPYRIWIHAHIKGPDGAPLLGGEKVNILAR
jgi:hypothetical protein